MAQGVIDNGTPSGAEQVGYYTRSTTEDIPFPSVPTSWNGLQRIEVYSLGWSVTEQSGGINLWAKVGFSGFGGSDTSALYALPAYAATPPVKEFAVSSIFTKTGTTAFNLTINIYKNSAGTTRTDNLYNTSANDDTRMRLQGGTSGHYYATLRYNTVPDAPTGITVNTASSNKPSSVTYTAPGNGGSAITSYVTLWQTSNTWGTSITWAQGDPTVATYSSNTTYYFNVLALNAIGDSPHGTAASWFYRTVTFNANGGSSTPTSLYPNNGEAAILPAAITRAGYTFAGWNTNSAGTGTTYAAGSSYTAAGDVTLYAKWTVNTPQIHNGTTFVRASASKIYNGTAFVDAKFKVWNGSSWTDPT
jgi:uncharacterized repeat protein (TIGR02543 family)